MKLIVGLTLNLILIALATVQADSKIVAPVHPKKIFSVVPMKVCDFLINLKDRTSPQEYSIHSYCSLCCPKEGKCLFSDNPKAGPVLKMTRFAPTVPTVVHKKVSGHSNNPKAEPAPKKTHYTPYAAPKNIAPIKKVRAAFLTTKNHLTKRGPGLQPRDFLLTCRVQDLPQRQWVLVCKYQGPELKCRRVYGDPSRFESNIQVRATYLTKKNHLTKRGPGLQP
jgi:hypothetical protein